MTDQTRNLLISLASHMAYMQGQLEARHELDDPEDYYWYRESVALRQKVTDALADGPAVPEGREPASVAAEASPTAPPIPVAGEVGELVAALRKEAEGWFHMKTYSYGKWASKLTRAATLLEQLSAQAPQPVPVSERLPGDQLCWWYEPDEDDDGSGYGGKWTLLRIRGGVSCYTHWLPATALPLPQGEVE
jgi:hypothetical protein